MNVLDDHSYLIILRHEVAFAMCGRADADGGSCGHQVPVDMSKPVEATRPGSVTLPPLIVGPHQRRLDVLTIVATLGGLLFRYDTGGQRRPGAGCRRTSG
jgi:hypothetical protein